MTPGTDHDQAGAVKLGADDSATDRRQALRKIHAIDHDHLALRQFRNRVRACRDADHIQQHVDGIVGVNAGPVMHIVRADHRTGELLQQIRFFVGAAR